MLRIFWTAVRKKRLLKLVDELTIEKLAIKFRRPPQEIELIIAELAPGKVPKVRVYYDRIDNKRVKITVYSARPAKYGIYPPKQLGSDFGVSTRL